MANHKSAIKRMRSSERKRLRNKATSSRIKSTIKKVFSAEKIEDAEKIYKEAVSILDKSVDRGRIHKNTAARNKSRLTKHINSLKENKVNE